MGVVNSAYLTGITKGLEGFWGPSLSKLTRPSSSLSRNEKTIVLDLFIEAVAKGHSGRAANWLSLFLWHTRFPDETDIDFWNVLFSDHTDIACTKKVLTLCQTVLFDDWKIRIQTMVFMVNIQESRLFEERKLFSLLTEQRELVANALIYIEYLVINRPTSPDFVGRFTSLEAKIAGLSYIIGKACRKIGRDYFPSSLGRNTYHDKIDVLDALTELGVSLRYFFEIKSKVIHFGYDLEKKGNEIKIVHRMPLFEESLANGFTSNLIHTLVSELSEEDSKAVDLEVEAVKLQDAFPELLTPMFGEGISERFRLEMPEDALPEIGKVLLQSNLFKEELDSLRRISSALLFRIDKILEKEIESGISIFDLVKFSRVIVYFSLIRQAALRKIMLKSGRTSVYWNSVLGRQKISDFIHLMSLMGFNQNKIEKCLRILSWSAADENNFDAFYSPLFVANENIHFLSSTLRYSSLIRNIFQKCKVRMDSSGEIDPIGELIEKGIKSKTSQVIKGVKYDYKEKSGDVDVIFRIDNDIYIFEIKNSLLPTDTFELRGLWEYIDKASRQLDRVKTLMQDPLFLKNLQAKLPFSLEGNCTLHTGIILGQRLFSGLVYKGHPVRSARELYQFVVNGEIAFGGNVEGARQIVKVWETPEFSSSDLVNYLSEESKIHNAFFKATELQMDTKEVGQLKVVERKFLVNALLFAKELKLDLSVK